MLLALSTAFAEVSRFRPHGHHLLEASRKTTIEQEELQIGSEALPTTVTLRLTPAKTTRQPPRKVQSKVEALPPCLMCRSQHKAEPATNSDVVAGKKFPGAIRRTNWAGQCPEGLLESLLAVTCLRKARSRKELQNSVSVEHVWRVLGTWK